MVADDSENKKPAAVAREEAKRVPGASVQIERELVQAKDALEHKIAELSESEALYRSALKAGRLVHWETDIAAGTRTWQKESKALFGLMSPPMTLGSSAAKMTNSGLPCIPTTAIW